MSRGDSEKRKNAKLEKLGVITALNKNLSQQASQKATRNFITSAWNLQSQFPLEKLQYQAQLQVREEHP